MKIARWIIVPVALTGFSTLALAQAVATQSNGNKPDAPSSQMRQPTTDGGLNESTGVNSAEPDSTAPQPAQTAGAKRSLRAPADQSFVRVATRTGMTEVELSKLALNQATQPEVKEFAEAVVRDYTLVNADLSAIAATNGLSIPTHLDAKETALVRRMKARTGKAFDEAYVREMVDAHARAVALFKTESSVGTDKLAAFAQKTLPSLQEHKRMADRLAS